MHYVFGPVPSRRLGQSLGIDTIPLKTCNWNCVYCQLGRTQPVVHQRDEYIPREDILAEVKSALQAHADGGIDWITFVGSGEPTLHKGIGWLIRQIKTITSLPIAVITNGSLLYLPEVREELKLADAVMPTLDAGHANLYRRINRPHPESTFERLIDGLIQFRAMYQGRLWVEVMLIDGLNDSETALRELASLLSQIAPDEIHLLLPTRPPVETWVRPADAEALLRAQAILGQAAPVIHPAMQGSFDLSIYENVLDAIVGIITRHPMSEQQLLKTLSRWSDEDVQSGLRTLQTSGRAQVVERYGLRFWTASGGHYPNQTHTKT